MASDFVPNVDKPHDRGVPTMRLTVQRGMPPDIEIDCRPRLSARGRTRIAVLVEWRQRGRGLFASVFPTGEDRSPLALFPWVTWTDGAGKYGRMALHDWRKLRIRPEVSDPVAGLAPGDDVLVRFTADCPSWSGASVPTRGVVVGINGDSVDVQIGDEVEPVDVDMIADVRSAAAERAEIDRLASGGVSDG